MATAGDPGRRDRVILISLLSALVLIAAVGVIGVMGLFSRISPTQLETTNRATASSAYRSEPVPSEPRADTPDDTTATLNLPPPLPLTELVGALAWKRETLLRLINNANLVMSQRSKYEALWAYCSTTVQEAAQIRYSDGVPETEYRLRPDGSVLTTSGKAPMTLEHFSREGDDRLVQDCVGSLFSYGTWQDQPPPTPEQFAEIVAKATANVEKIDETLDPRLVASLPGPPAVKEAESRAQNDFVLRGITRRDLDLLNAPITRSGQKPATEPVPDPLNEPTQPAIAASPTSGILCNGTVSVPQSGRLVFENLPGDRLKFTFDHEAWSATTRRQTDGKQTLAMHSLKPGPLADCHIRWEIAP
jgi:hypothetical protein